MTIKPVGEPDIPSEAAAPASPAEPPAPSVSVAGIGNRVLNVAKTVVTINDRLQRLDREMVRMDARWDDLTKQMTDLALRVERVRGELTSIDKRIAEKDRMLTELFGIRLEREVDKAVQAAVARLSPRDGAAPKTVPPKRGKPG